MKKILVLDDELDVEFIFKVMLEDEIDTGKIQIDFFSNAQACLDEFAKKPDLFYDYILSDINMPTIDGVQFIEKIRKNGYSGPTAFISAYIHDDYEKDMARLNISHFFSKPIDFNLIKELLKLDGAT
jgi:CheY-like chemotaxis protein